MGFALIVKLILLGLALFSAISYMLQRSSNKQNLADAIQHNQTTRQLTDDEFELLQRYLNNKNLVKPYKYQSSLVNHDVSVIVGTCIRHSFSTNGTESSYYFVIDNIEVFFPYSMEKYTMSENFAEVVFTERYAFVVSINGYDLATAKAQQEQEVVQAQQWDDGSRGQFKSIRDDELDALEQQNNDSETINLINQAKNKHCEILAQRDETVFEKNNAIKPNTGFVAVIFTIFFIICGINYDGFSQDLWLLIISIVSLLLAAYFYWRKPKYKAAKINRVRGTIDENNKDDYTILVGDNLRLSYPKYWLSFLPEKTTTDVDLDATVTDKKLVRYGHSLSIDKEVENFGPVKYWGRNCFLLIVGFFSLCVIYFSSSSITGDAIYSYQFLKGQISTKTIYNESKLKSTAINKGELINIDINGASCDIDNYNYYCDRVFINNQPIDVSENLDALPTWVKKLSEGSLIITHRDRQVELLESYEKMYQKYDDNYNYNSRYKNNDKYTKLSNIDQLVLVIDEACKVNDKSACTRLKEIFTILLPEKEDNELETWADAVDYANKKPQADKLIYISTVNEIERLFDNLSEKFLEDQIQQLKLKLAKLQNSNNSILLIALGNPYPTVSTPLIQSFNTYDNLATISYYNQILSLGAGHVDIKGLVTDITYREDNSIYSITINQDKRYQVVNTDIIPAALVNISIFLLMLIITITQAIILINKIIKNKYRLNRILDEYKHSVL